MSDGRRNPRRVQLTPKVQREELSREIKYCGSALLLTLGDKFAYSVRSLRRVWNSVITQSDRINCGECSLSDMAENIKDKTGIEMRLPKKGSATLADVRKNSRAIAWIIMLNAVLSSEGISREDAARLWTSIGYLINSVETGYLSHKDVAAALADDYLINIT